MTSILTEPCGITPDDSVLQVGVLALSDAARRATLNGADLDLSGTEFALLRTLAAAADTAVSVGALVRAAGWQGSPAALTYLDLYIRFLRDKLGDDRRRPAALLSVRRSGYLLSSAALQAPAARLLHLPGA